MQLQARERATSSSNLAVDEQPFSEDLLRGFYSGDRDALSQIYFMYVDRIASLLRRRFDTQQGGSTIQGVRDPDGEADLLQDIFIRAFSDRARRAYDGRRPYLPLLWAIARNVSIDFFRRVNTREQLGHHQAEEATSGDEPEQRLDDDRLRQRTRTYVAGLDAKSREYIRLRFVEDASQERVAATMRITRRRIRTLERRTLEGLRAYLED